MHAKGAGLSRTSVLEVVHAHDEHRRVAGRSRDDDLLGATNLVLARTLFRGEDACAQQNITAEVTTPRFK